MYNKKNISFTDDEEYLYDFLVSKGNASKYVKKLLKRQYYIEKGFSGLVEDELGDLDVPSGPSKNTRQHYDNLDTSIFKGKKEELVDEENKRIAKGILL